MAIWTKFAVMGGIVPCILAVPTVTIGQTTLQGRTISTFNEEFFGNIPFAKPPVGALRFEPPVLQTTLAPGTFDASNFGLACLQTDVPVAAQTEDCLTINVLRPAGTPANASLPVMAWVYGGGFTSGTASIYNASVIVAQSASRGTPVVYVNLNYRLGPLGFPQGNEVAAHGSLNLGLKDQLAALEWIQANIGAFGGDKTKVTVFGESAGAISLAILYLNPELEKLARAAIFESGSAATTLTFTPSHGETDWENFVRAVPACAATARTGRSVACLKSVNSTALLTAFSVAASESQLEFPWSPTVDGEGGVYPDFPSRLFAQGQFAKLPFIAGTNIDEGTVFTPVTINNNETIRQALIANFTPSLISPGAQALAADKILELYPDVPSLGSPFNTGNETFGLSPEFKRAAAINGDVSFQSQRRLWIQTASNASVKTFGYLFTDPQTATAPQFGVAHGSEVVYVYGAPNTTSPASRALSVNMVDYWISFATSLDPNDGRGSTRITWPQYTPDNQSLIQLNGANTTIIPDTYRSEQISFINADPLLFHHRR